MQWHIALTEPGKDSEAAKALRNRCYVVYNPICLRRVSHGRGKMITRVRPMFPGYIFVDAGPQGWHRLETCPGIRTINSLLKGFNGYAILPEEAYQEIRRTEVSLMNPRAEDGGNWPFKVGGQVFVQKGPFAGFFAKVEHLDDDEAVGLLMNIFGRESRTEMPANYLVAV